MKRFSILFFFVFAFIISAKAGDSIDVEKLRSKITELQSKSNELKPKATELKNLFEGYKTKAKSRKCDDALKEAEDGLDMAEKAVKDCEEVDKIAAKVLKAKKPKDVQKMAEEADKKVKNAKYFIQQSEDRKKEVEFEMKGCN